MVKTLPKSFHKTKHSILVPGIFRITHAYVQFFPVWHKDFPSWGSPCFTYSNDRQSLRLWIKAKPVNFFEENTYMSLVALHVETGSLGFRTPPTPNQHKPMPLSAEWRHCRVHHQNTPPPTTSTNQCHFHLNKDIAECIIQHTSSCTSIYGSLYIDGYQSQQFTHLQLFSWILACRSDSFSLIPSSSSIL